MHLAAQKICMLVVGKEANTLSTLHGIANCVKTGRKIVSSNRASRSLQCRPHLLSVKFENLVHRFFRNENSDLEINVSHFGLLHWQQWQPPASATSSSFLLAATLIYLISKYKKCRSIIICF